MQRHLCVIMRDGISVLGRRKEDGFARVYNLYYQKLFQFVYAKTRSEYLAQEVVQLTFIRFWENRRSVPVGLEIDVQLFRMAKTILIDQHRRELVKLKHEDRVGQLANVTYEDNALVNRDSLARINMALERLPPVRKKVFQLSRQRGFSYQQIANHLSISTKTVENHISKAIKQLRNAISL